MLSCKITKQRHFRGIQHFRIWLLLSQLIFILGHCQSSDAQVLYGALTGTIVDQSKAGVAGATVMALNTQTGVSKQATTNNEGTYLISNVEAGTYKMTVSAPAFGTVVLEGIPVRQNTTQRADATLQVSQVNQTLTVEGSAQTLQTDKADVNHEISNKQLDNLPTTSTTGRNFQSLYRLVPGATPPAEQNSAGANPQRSQATNVNGVTNVTNSTRIDGATVTYPWLPYIIAYVPPQDAIGGINIVTNSFTAEQGTAGGSAVNIAIKSGANQFHGEAYEYNTNTAFNARSYFFQGSTVPKNILNQFGFTLGGPIKKDKLFFFMDWERTLQRQAISGFQTLPTDALKSGNFAGTATTLYNPFTGNPDGTGRQIFQNGQIPANLISPAAAKILALVPAPNINTGSNVVNNYFGAGGYAFTRDSADIKINYNPNERSSLFGRYSISPDTITDPQVLGAAGGNTFDGGQPGASTGTIQNVGAGFTYTITPNLLFDANAGFARQRLGAQADDIGANFGLDTLGIPGTNGPDPLQGGVPSFLFTGFSGFGNLSTGSPFLFRDNQYVGNTNLTWIKGSHSMRFGGEYTHSAINHFQPGGGLTATARGAFTFTGGLSALNGGPAPNLYNSFADFLLGLPQSEGKVLQNVNPNAVRWSTFAFYAQDQWQVNGKLTLTYGLRYEYYPFATRDHTGVFRFDPSSGNVLIGGENGVPQNTGVDVGWGNIVPRVGVAYRASNNTVIRAGFGLTVDPDNFRTLRDTYPAVITQAISGSGSFQQAGTLASGIPPVAGPNLSAGSFPLPANVGTTTVPADFNRGYIESWNFSVQHEIGKGFNAQASYVGTHAVRQIANVNINASFPGGGNAGRLLNPAFGLNADINSSQPYASSIYHGLQTQLTRRLGDGQFGAVYTWSRALNFEDNSAQSGLTFAYPTYWGRNRALAGYDRTHNFQFWGVYALPFGKGKTFVQNGIASYILGGWQLNGILSRTSGLPFTVTASGASLNAPGNTQVADQVLPNVDILGGRGTTGPYFDPAAFSAVTNVRFGSAGRNSLRGPGIFDLDLSLFRGFAITDRFNLQFRAEAFALTNTPQFANPQANISAGNFGYVTSVNGGSRVLRLGLKFMF